MERRRYHTGRNDTAGQRLSAAGRCAGAGHHECGSFSDPNLHTRGSFEAFRRVASPQRWLYTHRDGKWAHFYSAEAIAAQAAFFDHFLKGSDNGWDRTPAVRLAVHDEGPDPVAVLAETDWPPPDLTWTSLHLDLPGRLLTTEAGTDAATADFDLRKEVLSRPHATRVRAGDTLRLDIRGTWHFPRNPLTGQFPAAYQRSPAGRCVLHAGGPYDSRLLLGVREPRNEPVWRSPYS